MKVKDIIDILPINQQVFIKNQFGDDTYDGYVKDINENEFAEKIKDAEITNIYTNNKTHKDYILINSKEEE